VRLFRERRVDALVEVGGVGDALDETLDQQETGTIAVKVE